MAVDILIDKINKYAQAKTDEHNNKVDNEMKLREEYINKIKGMSDRISDLLKVANAIRFANVPKGKTGYLYPLQNQMDTFIKEVCKTSDVKLQFGCGLEGRTQVYSTVEINENEERPMLTTILYDEPNPRYTTDHVKFMAHADGTVEYLRMYHDTHKGSYWKEDKDYPMTSKVLFRFLTEFDRFEKAVMDFVANL